ncbi:hypothetical protein BH09PAT4_BH09PAT4_07050 [soil metagenome]
MSAEQLSAEINPSAFYDDAGHQPTVKLHGAVRVSGEKKPVEWTAEFPEVITYEGLTLLIPGFGGIKRSSRDERHANAVQGRPTISYDPARISGSIRENLFNSQDLHTRTAEEVLYAVQERISSDRSIPSPGKLDVDRVVLSAHSMGGFAATELGLKHPGLTESVIYKGAAGFWPLSLRDMKPLVLLQEINAYVASGRIEPSIRNLYRIARYYSRDLSRTTGEAATCLTQDISARIEKLGERTTTAYLGFENDPLVPVDKAQQIARPLVNRFVILGGVGHLAPQLYPEDTAWATWDLQQSMQATQRPALHVVGSK